MEDGCHTPDNQNASSPSSTASGSSSSVRDMAKMLAMSVFSRGKKRKLDHLKDGCIDDASTNSDDSLSAPIAQKRVAFPSNVNSAPIVKEKISVVPISRISANNTLQGLTHAPPESIKRKEALSVSDSIGTRNSPILKNLLFTSTSVSNQSPFLSVTSERQETSSSIPSSIPITTASIAQSKKDPKLLKTLLTPLASKTPQENTDRTRIDNTERPISTSSIAKKPESTHLKFLCCFSTLVLKPPVPGDIKRSTKTEEQYVSYVCYAFDKGTLMCNKGAPTEKVWCPQTSEPSHSVSSSQSPSPSLQGYFAQKSFCRHRHLSLVVHGPVFDPKSLNFRLPPSK